MPMACIGNDAILDWVVEFDTITLSTQEPFGWLMVLGVGLFVLVVLGTEVVL
jgi:hypothetical protein